MPALFIHGAPATHRLWSHVIAELGTRDVIAEDLPGFGAPVPDGFDASKEAYVDWLISRIEAVGKPVDIVGHDWGCMLALRVASLRPDLVRSWAAGGGPINAAYEWHPLAKTFQTEGDGEAFFRNLSRDGLRDRLVDDGVPPDDAADIPGHIDDVMADCLLRLYRSAVTVGREWQPGLRNVCAPGLVIWGKRDGSVPPVNGEILAADTRATRIVVLDAGHWFPLERPALVADALRKHWELTRSVPSSARASPSP